MFRYYQRSNEDSPNTINVSIAAEHKEGVLKIAVARCSNKDNFIKKKGRLIAENRLAKDLTYKEVPLDNCEIKDFIDLAMKVAKEVEETKEVYSPEVKKAIELAKDAKKQQTNLKKV